MSRMGGVTMLASPTWPRGAGAAARPDLPVRGRALVARASDRPPAVGPGTVLVIERLSATWVPLLGEVAAVVVESGGALSNAATLLRERGIPAVFGVDGAMRALRDGDAVEVDATHGVVCLVR
jgi:phosphohistidine swiveling domain-containing protein